MLSFSRIGYQVRSRLDSWAPVTELDGVGHRVLVTGGNSGLGLATVQLLLASGAEVVATTRSDDKDRATRAAVVEQLGPEAATRLTTVRLDLADLSSVRACAQELTADGRPLTAVVHNAGAMFAERSLTDDRLERTYQVHVVGPFLLTQLLLPVLRAAAPSRVVFVTSGGMYTQRLDVDRIDSPDGYRGAVAYARAKRAQVALTRAFARREGPDGVCFHVAHPGWASTPGVAASLPGFQRLLGPVLRSPEQGAETTAYLVLAADLPGAGRLWHDRRVRSAHKVAWTTTPTGEVDRLWDRVRTDAGLDQVAD